jgi:hypothetical protein
MDQDMKPPLKKSVKKEQLASLLKKNKMELSLKLLSLKMAMLKLSPIFK